MRPSPKQLWELEVETLLAEVSRGILPRVEPVTRTRTEVPAEQAEYLVDALERVARAIAAEAPRSEVRKIEDCVAVLKARKAKAAT